MRIDFLVIALTASVTVHAGPVDECWQSLRQLCDNAYEGELITHPESETGFVGHRVMHVRDCREDRIPTATRMKSTAGDNMELLMPVDTVSAVRHTNNVPRR